MTPSEIIATVLRASCHQFIGRLGSDPEIKFFDNGNCVAKGRIAINRPGAKKDDGQAPDWFTVEIWGDQGQAFADKCRKGDRINVMGRVKTNRWTTNAGEQRTDLIVLVDAWRSMDVPAPAAPAQTPAPTAAPAPAPAAAPVAQAAQQVATAFQGTVVEVDDIPF
jgi:single-strand DNA-binding protein